MLSFVQAYYRFADTMDPDVWFEPSEVICTLNLNNLFSVHFILGFFGDSVYAFKPDPPGFLLI